MERRATRRAASPRGSASPVGAPVVSQSTAPVAQGKPTWGRFQGSFGASLGCLAIISTTPFLSFWFVMACEHFDCQLVNPLLEVFVYGNKPFSWITQYLPFPTWKAFQVWFVWYAYQVAMALFFPGPKGYGQLTPAGNVLEYKVNGMNVWIVSHILFIGGAYLGFFPATIVYDNWPALVVIANIWGNFLALFTYIKAYYFPTHAEDRKISGNHLYDYFMGIEFNPRIGNLDFKLFFNGRPGICGWTIINISFAAAQYAKWGYVTNSMLIVNLLHAIYVVDFFYNEDWYLRTIDIAHDHFGWMLAWGDSVWLPFTYTLQCYFLVTHPVVLTHFEAASILALGFGGYYIFRSCNHQKDYFRSNDGNCLIWGKPARYVAATFTTSDGKTRNSKLLTSGWWGLSRHFNYVGDLMISLAYCLPCGFTLDALLLYYLYDYFVGSQNSTRRHKMW